MTRTSLRMVFWASAALMIVGCGTGIPGIDPHVEVVEVTDRTPPKPVDDGLTEDRLEDKQTSFDPELVDRRPLGDWQINQSEAVISLDVPLVQPDYEADLLILHPSYRAAMSAAQNRNALPSVNLIDGKAKQFDDGLYAAIDLAYFQGVSDKLPSHQQFVKRLLERVGDSSPAAPFLAAGLTLGGQETPVPAQSDRDDWIRDFQQTPQLAKPIGFYTWSDSLKQCWAFMRFFQQELDPEKVRERAIIAELTAALEHDTTLKADYESILHFFGRLTNPLYCLSLTDVANVGVILESRVL